MPIADIPQAAFSHPRVDTLKMGIKPPIKATK
jgi:hypothetical protein